MVCQKKQFLVRDRIENFIYKFNCLMAGVSFKMPIDDKGLGWNRIEQIPIAITAGAMETLWYDHRAE